MKRLPIFLVLAFFSQVFCAALPVFLRLLPLPDGVLCFFGRSFPIPAAVILTSFAYGALRLKKGGGLPAAALTLSPLALFGFIYTLPYTTSFFNLHTLSASAFLAIVGEIGGRVLFDGRKKRKS